LFQIVFKKQFGFSPLMGKSYPLVGMNHREFATVDLTCLLYTSCKIELD